MDYLRTNFVFVKPYYRRKEFLELFSMSESTLKRYMAEQRGRGLSLSEMGYLLIEGFREDCWQPQIFLDWLMENKVIPEAKYDYDLRAKREAHMTVVNLNKKMKHKEAYNGN
jgi:hypothetical protein